MFENHKQKKKRLRDINNSYNALFNYLYDVPKESYYWSVWMGWILAHGFGFEGPNPNSLFG